ncbi:hypothetical protein G7046_g8724 [Stylonectria norvegica]|nr:hypothetical protein G7046_g8724 [Stylonectria norvegica]
MDAQTQHRLPPPKVGGLTNILNNDEHHPQPHNGPHRLRDSGFYSTADASSKHTSAASFNVNGLSPAGSGYQSSSQDKTPSPIASNMMPQSQSLVSPSVSNMSVSAMVSPSTPDRRYERPTSIESIPSGTTLGENLAVGMGGPRRESVDSRLGQGLRDLQLDRGSPYASHNQSTTSIQNTLHNQRNPQLQDHLAIHRISNGYQPSADRNPESKSVKTAPAITGPATGHIARAAEPTKGQAWAFPEEEIQRVGGLPGFDDSRRSSITESIASSQFTTESRLPSGQRRLEDGDYARMSNTSEFPPVHHHTMQHKQLSDLQAEEANGAGGAQPYSRTPELRVSHKLAERKRRTEMKDLFDTLRDLMPQERGSKASKWEILTKAIAEHQRQTEHIRLLQQHYAPIASENEMLRNEVAVLRGQLRGEPTSSSTHAPPPQAPAPQPPAYALDSYANSARTELPPIRSISNGISGGPDSMTGVQYDSSRSNGYRPERY